MGTATTFREYVEQRASSSKEATSDLYRNVNVVPYLALDANRKPTYPDDYERKASQWCSHVYDSSVSRIAEDPEIKKVRAYINMIMGDQWPHDRPPYRPRPVLNYVSKHFWDNLANISDVHLDVDIRSENKDYKDIAEKLTKAVQSAYRAQRGNLAMIGTAQHASLSIGFTKVAWSRSKNDVVYIACGPDRVIPIFGDTSDIQNSAGVIYSQWKPLTWFQTNFDRGFMVKDDTSQQAPYGRDKPYWVEDYSWSAFSPGLKEYLYRSYENHQGGGDPAFQLGRVPIALYNEFWLHDPQINTSGKDLHMGWGNWQYTVKHGQAIYPFGRLIITAGTSKRVILWDGPNPHWHGQFPFAALRPSPVPWLWSSVSDLRDLGPVQMGMNNVIADALGVLKLAVNKVLITKEGSMADETWNNYFPGMPGAKIKLVNRMESIDQQIKFFGPDPSAIGAAVPLYNLLRSAFGELGGDIDNRLAGKEQVPSSESIQKFQDSQQARYRIKGHFVESFFMDIGTLASSDVMQYYTSDKVLSVLGPDGQTWDYIDWDPGNAVPYDHREPEPFRRGNSFVKQLHAMVSAGSGLPEQRRETAKIAMVLRKMGNLDMHSLIKKLQRAGYALPDADVIIKNIKDEMAELPQPEKKGK